MPGMGLALSSRLGLGLRAVRPLLVPALLLSAAIREKLAPARPLSGGLFACAASCCDQMAHGAAADRG